jgi:LCP family protein required for cell wall assembly
MVSEGVTTLAAVTPKPEKTPRASRGMFLRFAMGAVIIVACTAGAVSAGILLQVKDLVTIIKVNGHTAKLAPDTVTPAEAGKPQTLLLVGSDHRYGEPGDDARSDTMMLVRLDPKQQATAVMSIPRDLRVEIPGHGTDKINAAYSFGGLDLTARTVKQLLSTPGHPFKINHVVGVSFAGFRNVVDYLNCVYTDVDRRYYHSNLGLPPSQQYSEIDIQPGYQKLCGTKALQYVRFRHLDNDIVRAARQQDFLRDTKDQMAGRDLLGDMKPLLRIFAKATEFDASLEHSSALLRLAKLAIFSTGHPVLQFDFPATFVDSPSTAPVGVAGATGAAGTGVGGTGATAVGLGSYVTATPDQISAIVDKFMHAKAPSAAKKKKATKGAPSTTKKPRSKKASAPSPASYGLVDATTAGENLAAAALVQRHAKIPFYLPHWLTPRGQYPQSTANAPQPRFYTIKDRAGRPHAAYRLVVAENVVLGQYYGIQGTTWKSPPILAGATDTKTMRGRKYQLGWDGSKLRVVAWTTKSGTYWVSNTLSMALTNKEMLGIAYSLTRFGG